MDDDLRRFEAAVDRFAEALSRPGNTGNQVHYTVNAGGVGVLVASVCCTVMFTITVIGVVVGVAAYGDMKDEFAEVREDQRATKAYLQGIWQQAPHLKPEESK